MRLQDGLEHDFVEALLFNLAVCLGFGHRCRRAAGSSRLACSAGGSSELPSVSLLLCAHAVPLDGPWARARVHISSVALWRLGCRTGWACRLARIVGAGQGCWTGEIRQADLCVACLQVTKLLRAKVATD